jgi:putative DNA primase/helicase
VSEVIDLDAVRRAAAEAAASAPSAAPWADRLLYRVDKNGKRTIQPCVSNAIMILTNDVRWKDVLAWDEFAQDMATLTVPPWGADEGHPGLRAGIWTDSDTTRLCAWFERVYSLRLPAAVVFAAATVVAERRRVHPVRDYLSGLRWDGVGRVSTWLTRYMGAEDSAYARAVAQWFLISAVARIFDPGCKVDTMPVFEGAQGARKSSALRTLFSAPWFSDTPVDLESKDRFIALREKWLLEFGELDSFIRADLERIKGFLSSASDTYRPPYGRGLVTRPRCCVFAGSTNRQDYLRDETGNRRFWPVTVGAVGAIDLDGLTADRDQLWAEAVHLYRAGARWWAEKAEDAMATAEQSARLAVDAWTARIQAHLDKAMLASDPWVTVGDVLGLALDIPAGRWSSSDQQRVGRVLRVLGWERKQRRCQGDGSRREWGYRPAASPCEGQNEGHGAKHGDE